MTKIMITSYNPHRDGQHLLDGVVACYQKSFAGAPWNESHFCLSCNTQYGEDAMKQHNDSLVCPLVGCEGILQEVWPAETVKADFLSETEADLEKGKFPSAWVALIEETVVGICWGYTINIDLLIDKVELPSLKSKLLARFGEDTVSVAYLDELAVLPEYRRLRYRHEDIESCGISLDNQKPDITIAKALVSARHSALRTMDPKVSVVRTLAYPPTKTYSWYTNVGFEIVDRYPENENRVILARSFERISDPGSTDGVELWNPF